MNCSYDDISSKISLSLVGPLREPTNTSRDIITIEIHIGDGLCATKYFDIERSSDDQSKLDIVTFAMDIDTKATQLNLSLHFSTNADDAIALQLLIDTQMLNTQIGAICGGIILITLNVLIISEVKKEFIINKIDEYFKSDSQNCTLIGHSPNTGCITSCICIDWDTGSVSRSTNHGRHYQVD